VPAPGSRSRTSPPSGETAKQRGRAPADPNEISRPSGRQRGNHRTPRSSTTRRPSGDTTARRIPTPADTACAGPAMVPSGPTRWRHRSMVPPRFDT
jgi:hypothetical protein